MAILLKGCISPVGGASAVEGMQSMGLTVFVLFFFLNFLSKSFYGQSKPFFTNLRLQFQNSFY
jgi:hypothetical protein